MKISKIILLLIFIIAAFFLWDNRIYSIDIYEGGHRGIEIGMNADEVIAVINRRLRKDFSYLTLSVAGSDRFSPTVPIDEINPEFVIKYNVWSFHNDSHLRSLRITFNNDNVVKIEDWNRWMEWP